MFIQSKYEPTLLNVSYLLFSVFVNSCIGDNCHFFCAACDNVFHKAVAKRGHIRIPVIASDPLRSVLLMMPEDLREIIRGLPTWREFVCRVEFSNRDEDPFSDSLSLISSVMLNGIRGLVDDRRVSAHVIIVILYCNLCYYSCNNWW